MSHLPTKGALPPWTPCSCRRGQKSNFRNGWGKFYSIVPSFLSSVVSTFVRLRFRFRLFRAFSISSAFLSISMSRFPSRCAVVSSPDRFSSGTSFVAFFRTVLPPPASLSSSVIQELADAELSVLGSSQQIFANCKILFKARKWSNLYLMDL